MINITPSSGTFKGETEVVQVLKNYVQCRITNPVFSFSQKHAKKKYMFNRITPTCEGKQSRPWSVSQT